MERSGISPSVRPPRLAHPPRPIPILISRSSFLPTRKKFDITAASSTIRTMQNAGAAFVFHAYSPLHVVGIGLCLSLVESAQETQVQRKLEILVFH